MPFRRFLEALPAIPKQDCFDNSSFLTRKDPSPWHFWLLTPDSCLPIPGGISRTKPLASIKRRPASGNSPGARLPPDAKGVKPILLGASPELPGGWGRGMRISYKRVPVVRKSRCTACGLCGSVCPNACLGVLGGSGALVQPDACTSEGYCVSACRESAIRMKWVHLNGNRSIGQWRVRSSMPRQLQQSAASTSGCGN